MIASTPRDPTWLWSNSLQTNAVEEPEGSVLISALPKGAFLFFLTVVEMVTLKNFF